MMGTWSKLGLEGWDWGEARGLLMGSWRSWGDWGSLVEMGASACWSCPYVIIELKVWYLIFIKELP